MNRVLNYIGLASRGRFVAFGEDALVLAKPQHVVFIAFDASESTKDKVARLCKRKSIPMITPFSKDELAQACGKNQVAILLIKNTSLAKQILKTINQKGE